MNKTISKILIGISAIFAAGVLSFVPGKTAKAAAYAFQPTTSTVEVVVDGNYQSNITNATVNWSIPGVNPQTDHLNDADSQVIGIMIESGVGYAVIAQVVFDHSINVTGNCSVSYSFAYAGTNYSGTISLINLSNYNFEGYITVYYSDLDNGGSEFSRAINAKVNDIDMAFRGLNPDGTINESKTVEYNYNGAINEKIIAKLAQAEGVTLLYTFEYQGYVFTSVISSEDAAKIFSQDIPWYGPCYIASNCPTVMVGVAE